MALASGGPLDTIFALASGAGRAAIGVIRISGDQSAQLLRSLAGRMPPPRHASLCRLRDELGATLDHAMVLWMPAPASYTGEDTAELHLHGGRATVQAIMNFLVRAGARPADAGEFTRRAFLAGKMDLLRAEAIADLGRAETEAQRMLALTALNGRMTRRVEGWACRIKRALAQQEALIDFPDETSEHATADTDAGLQSLAAELAQTLSAAPVGARIREGLTVVISGAPNVGKSSLFNLLSQRDAAMVSPTPGTTRDALEARLDLSGVAVTMVDTAGVREAADALEAEGVRRALLRTAEADIILHVTDHTQPVPSLDDPRIIWIDNKLDVSPARTGAIGVSTVTMEGTASLLERLTDRIHALTYIDGNPITSTARQTAALRDALAALLKAVDAAMPELRAEDLRAALSAIGRLAGQVHTEAVLDVIFSTFCIGK